ncbi:hypothetical protein [Frigoribacterium sp. SL97]|uniref:hypothetical protein n=1 Tax=Frigoribacterium sp. SL97 TaxID=2994664 RepID=UPI00226D9DCC|nr:hypothetical protein [Frigoribacterium sp. SL97]WAC50383.1 hypothetical protein OVA02_10810 [Frigoribacterium sp. SL97]
MPLPPTPLADEYRSPYDLDDEDEDDDDDFPGNSKLSFITPMSRSGLTLDDVAAIEDWAVNGTLIRRDVERRF